MAEFLALVRRSPRFAESEFAPHLAPEAVRVRQLYADGVIRRIWSRLDVPGAAIVLEAESLEKIDELLDSLPLKAIGMLEIDVIPLKPYRGFAPGA